LLKLGYYCGSNKEGFEMSEFEKPKTTKSKREQEMASFVDGLIREKEIQNCSKRTPQQPARPADHDLAAMLAAFPALFPRN
jgi:hypothetical protein